MNQTVKDIGSILWVLLLLSIPATIIFFVWLGKSRVDAPVPDTLTVINDSRSPVRIAYYDADGKLRRMLATGHPELAPGEERPVGGGYDCENPNHIPRPGGYLLAQTPDGRTARLGPPRPCQSWDWRITEESLRKGVKPTPSPPLWSPTPASSEKSAPAKPG